VAALLQPIWRKTSRPALVRMNFSKVGARRCFRAPLPLVWRDSQRVGFMGDRMPKIVALLLAASSPRPLRGARRRRAWLYATSLIEPTPKYPADFKRFDYVKPGCPQGRDRPPLGHGLVRFAELLPPKGATAERPRPHLRYTLMTSSLDEVLDGNTDCSPKRCGFRQTTRRSPTGCASRQMG